MSTHSRKDVILWGALGCALVSTAHAEYTLATATQVHWLVAGAVPGALDLYVIRALQQRKDVALAVLVMVAANVTSHLITADVIPVHWTVTAAVGALAPVILGRVYFLKHRASAGTGATSAPVPLTSPEAEYNVPAAPDHVPAAWMIEEYPETHPQAFGCVWRHDECAHSDGECTLYSAPVKPSAVPYLAPVPDLPAEYAEGAVHSESPLTASDWDYLPGAQKYVDDVANPTVRGCKRELRIGQERAERLLTHLGVLL